MPKPYCAHASVESEEGDQHPYICRFTNGCCVGDSNETDHGADYFRHDSGIARLCPLYSQIPLSTQFEKALKKERLTIKKSELQKKLKKIDEELGRDNP